MFQLKGRTVINVEVTNIDMRDYPDFCDAYIESATFEDGTELTENELIELQETNTDAVYEAITDTIY